MTYPLVLQQFAMETMTHLCLLHWRGDLPNFNMLILQVAICEKLPETAIYLPFGWSIPHAQHRTIAGCTCTPWWLSSPETSLFGMCQDDVIWCDAKKKTRRMGISPAEKLEEHCIYIYIYTMWGPPVMFVGLDSPT